MDKCPKCGNTENFHYNYDWTKQHRPVIDVLCNECGETFKQTHDWEKIYEEKGASYVEWMKENDVDMKYQKLESGDTKDPKKALIELAILFLFIVGILIWSKYVNN